MKTPIQHLANFKSRTRNNQKSSSDRNEVGIGLLKTLQLLQRVTSLFVTVFFTPDALPDVATHFFVRQWDQQWAVGWESNPCYLLIRQQHLPQHWEYLRGFFSIVFNESVLYIIYEFYIKFTFLWSFQFFEMQGACVHCQQPLTVSLEDTGQGWAFSNVYTRFQ